MSSTCIDIYGNVARGVRPSLSSLQIGEYTFVCKFIDNATLPPYKGSTFRGVLGHALRSVVCPLKSRDCNSSCPLAGECFFYRLFSGGESNKPDLYNVVEPPRPYVLEPPLESRTHYRKDDAFVFKLVLFGELNSHVRSVIYAFVFAGEKGLGASPRARFAVTEVRAENGLVYDGLLGKFKGEGGSNNLAFPVIEQMYGEPISCRVVLETPLRLKFQNRLTASLPFHVLIRAALRRVSAVFAAYGSGEPILDYSGLIRQSEVVKVSCSDLHWFDWRRYSNRQEAAMLMGGMEGSITYFGHIGEFLPLLSLAARLHIGKQTTFGLGKLRIIPERPYP